MAIQDTDLFLVNRSGTSYKVEAQNLDDKLQADDLLLVNNNGNSRKATGAELRDGTVPDAALMLINSNGLSYQVTGAEVKALLGGSSGGDDVVSKPGTVSWLDSSLALRQATSPVELISVFSPNTVSSEINTDQTPIACGVDGKLYTMPVLRASQPNDSDQAFTLASGRAVDQLNASGKHAIYCWFSYSPGQQVDGTWRNGYVIHCDDGTVLTTTGVGLPAGEIAERIIILGSVCDYCFVVAESGRMFGYNLSGVNITVGGVTLTNTGFTEIPVPAGVKYIGSYAYGTNVYVPNNVIMLGNDGYLYVIGSPNFGLTGAVGSFAAATPATTYGNDWIKLQCLTTSNSSAIDGFTALKSNGELWGGGNINPTPSTFGLMETGCTSIALGTSQETERYYLLKDGGQLYYCDRGTTTFNPASALSPISKWNNFNALESNSSGTNACFIVPN